MKVISVFLICLVLVRASSVQSQGSASQSDVISLLAQRSNENFAATYPPNAGFTKNLNPDGHFSDIDYAKGCQAGRAVWKASDHWARTVSLATAWMSSGDPKILNATRSAANYWFSNDYGTKDCTNNGGKPSCPCNTPGLWNLNWWWQVVFVPNRVGPWCVLLQSKGVKLTPKELASCRLILQRSWGQVDNWTAANVVWVSANGISLGILNSDYGLIKASFQKAFSTAVISSGGNDGIKVDGSFFQHKTLLYNGNYGQGFMGDIFSFIEFTAGIPDLYPSPDQQDSLSRHIIGSEWMGYFNKGTNRFIWDPSVCGRFFAGKQVKMSIPLKSIQRSIDGWKYGDKLRQVIRRLNSTGDSVNPGGLIGNRMFWKSDYLVQRGLNYVVTLKMFSSRISNTECINSQNLQGYHQSGGVLFTFTDGDEYQDFPAVWDWRFLPGITVDPTAASNLTCKLTRYNGKQNFVGGVSDGKIGAAVMSFTDPMNGQLTFTKSWFFFEDVYFVVISDINQRNGQKVFTVLDQRAYREPFDSSSGKGTSFLSQNPTWMIHDKTGYLFPTSSILQMDRGQVNGDWDSVGTGWINGKVSKNVILSTLTSKDGSLSYIAIPGVDENKFNDWKNSDWKKSLRILSSSSPVHVVQHTSRRTFGMTFLKASSFNLTSNVQVTSDSPVILLLENQTTGSSKLTIADPTQLLSSVVIRIRGTNLNCNGVQSCKKVYKGIEISVTLPKNEDAGSSVSISLKGDLL